MPAHAAARALRTSRGEAPPRHAVRTADLVLTASLRLDQAAGRPAGHAARTCLLAMRLAEAVEIPDRDRASLFYAALLHDAGDLSDEPAPGRPTVLRRLMPWQGNDEERRAAEHARVRRGAQVVLRAGFGPQVAVTIMSLRERWDGNGLPLGLAGDAIPLYARVVSLAEALDDAARDAGPRNAEATIYAGSGTAFDPELTGVMLALCGGGLLEEWTEPDLTDTVRDLEPDWLADTADEEDENRIWSALLG
jgi:HD-GYP domain-containing protein (c-di-GMP phosphodiesterase class II)